MSNYRILSTDKDLLEMQKVLGRVRKPQLSDQELVALVDKSRGKLKQRFVVYDVVKGGEGIKTLPKHKMRKMYNMEVSFRCRGVKGGTGSFTMRANFRMRNIPGKGTSHEMCLQEAKEEFRKRLGLMIRDSKSAIYKQFFDLAKIEETLETGEDPDKDLAKEAFRKWIGLSIRDVNSNIYKSFFRQASHEEVKVTMVCPSCKKRQFEYDFVVADAEGNLYMQKECVACKPGEFEEDEEEEEDDEEEDDELVS